MISELESFEKESSKRIFNVFCMEEWIQEKYVPSQIKQHLQDRMSFVQQQHTLFCKLVATGDVFDAVTVCFYLFSNV